MIVALSSRRASGHVFDTFRGPRLEARTHARAYLARFHPAGYMTEIDGWMEHENGEIEFTMRRLASAD